MLTLLIFGGCGFPALLIFSYRSLLTAGPPCALDITPANFQVAGIDTTRYQMPTFQDVSFPARGHAVTIRAFYAPVSTADAPTVILSHGLGSCRRGNEALIPAGMLHQAGFNVLMLDLRNMGESARDNELHALGSKEYRDVLGAYDWLIQQGAQAGRIGVYGVSLGGATVLNAAGAEPGIAAAWTDSAFADPQVIVNDIAADTPLIQVLLQPGLWMGRMVYGDDIYSQHPVEAVARFGDRPLFLVHGTPDQTVPYKHMSLLEQAAVEAGVTVESWTTDSQHVFSIYDYTADYESRLIAFFQAALG
jgi:dipeptidyl aminopeptidase/acylaminoacyl peptidase